ncbi:MAG: site-specific DNA-methyltransferase [Planctomycetes bacterium]|nr:site-specific DNA-methyltransferase [Planctomycetota bacterium]
MTLFPDKYKDTMVRGDCLEVMGGLPDACLDLIYIDPPFNTGKARKGENLPIGPGGRVRLGDPKKTYEFNDAWEGHLEGYLDWLQPRLEEARRLLKSTGALLVHLDGHASHYVKVLLDRIMGPRRFLNEIIWHYRTGGSSRRCMARKFDSIFWYGRGKTHTYNPEEVSRPGNRCALCGKVRDKRNHMKRTRDEDGRPMLLIKSAGKVYKYYEDAPVPLSDVWLDIQPLHQRDPERTGYPAQKPLKLMERLVMLCSNPGEVVADFFAGTGTTLIAAARLNRHWFGCDAREEALEVANLRLKKHHLPLQADQWKSRGS